MRLLILNAPEEYIDLVAPLPAGVELAVERQPEAALLQVFVSNLGECRVALTCHVEVCAKNSLLWITYPKVASRSVHGLSRDVVREALRKLGWRAVSIVAVGRHLGRSPLQAEHCE